MKITWTHVVLVLIILVLIFAGGAIVPLSGKIDKLESRVNDLERRLLDIRVLTDDLSRRLEGRELRIETLERRVHNLEASVELAPSALEEVFLLDMKTRSRDCRQYEADFYPEGCHGTGFWFYPGPYFGTCFLPNQAIDRYGVQGAIERVCDPIHLWMP